MELREEAVIILHLFIMFTAAKVFAEIFIRIKQPVVIGELLAGAMIGVYGLGWVTATPVNDAIAELGVIILLFAVGLETRMDTMAEVGWPAVFVGIFGVLVPLGLGFASFQMLGYDMIRSLFMGTAMVATSIGITARVLGDMGLIRHRVSRIILGAAILDDILGLMVLSIVASLAKGDFNYAELTILMVEAVFFVLFFTTIGPRLAGRYVERFLSRVRISEAPFVLGVIVVLGTSVLAEYIGLAAIIGAFLAGIVLSENTQFLQLEEEFKQVGNLLIPFFFVVMGTKFDILGLLKPSVLSILVFTVVIAVIGKLVGAAIGTFGLGWKTMLQTGIGMIPRGEVGIVVGTLGLALHIIDETFYGVVLGMSIVTTIIVPPMLGWAFKGETTDNKPDQPELII